MSSLSDFLNTAESYASQTATSALGDVISSQYEDVIGTELPPLVSPPAPAQVAPRPAPTGGSNAGVGSPALKLPALPSNWKMWALGGAAVVGVLYFAKKRK